jgi:hypothetical protein
MGTRGACGFIQEKKAKMIYNQFDSYPSGLGGDMVKTIIKVNREDGWDKFKSAAYKMKQLNRENITDELIEKYSKYTNLGAYEQIATGLLKDVQGSKFLDEMYSGDLEHSNFDNTFIKESLFCGYVYLINLDTMMLEFYSGFQKTAQLNNPFGEVDNGEGYYPCKLVGIFPLSEVNEGTVNEMDIILEQEENEVWNENVRSYLLSTIRKDKLEQLKQLN